MIFFYGEGRVGNQIFQYQAMCRIARPAETVVAVGLESLPDIFEVRGPRLRIVTRSRALKRLVKYVLIPCLLRPAARLLRLMNYVCESSLNASGTAEPAGEMIVRPGLFSRITFVDGGFYQDPSLWSTVFPPRSLVLSGVLRQAAVRYLRDACPPSVSMTFVHVRRGDYLSYTSYGLDDLALPGEFYRSAIAEIRQRVGATHLVFVTDDADWVRSSFSDVVDKTIVSADASTDFAIMTQCANGIVSNSTFALAAALMMTGPGLVVAPEYWLGFRVSRWYPPRIRYQHDRLLYLSATRPVQ
jgi:Glycosyl transferase family 11